MPEELLFDVKEASLDARNLIEASAGTGKTYSIALLVVRLILEKGPDGSDPISIDKILMVTFTNYAVAELESRVRLFVRSAYNYCEQPDIEIDLSIKTIVDRAIAAYGNGEDAMGRKKVNELLKAAILLLDEVMVSTIHGFCHKALTEFAFDTGQIFGAQALTTDDQEKIKADAINDFWRNHITVLKPEILVKLRSLNFNRELLNKVIKLALANKQFHVEAPFRQEDFSEPSQLELVDLILAGEQMAEDKQTDIKAYIQNNFETLIGIAKGNSFMKKWEDSVFQDVDSLYEKIVLHLDKANVQKCFPEICAFFDEINKTDNEIDEAYHLFINKLCQFAIQEVVQTIDTFKHKYSLIAFDDMIVNLYEAIRRNPVIAAKMQEKYKAVFIDEFQDTDIVQYEIFAGLFNENTVLFFIGDPKQSIYGFRKADIHTYFKARQEGVERLLEMNVNFRSGEKMISAMNYFFSLSADPFAVENTHTPITYIPVNAPVPGNSVVLKQAGAEQIPLSVRKLNTQDQVPSEVAKMVAHLLTSGFTIEKNGMDVPVAPSDIGILVRRGKEGIAIKKALARFNIPAVTIDDSKILQSTESKELLYLLQAVREIKKENINKALLTGLTRYTINEVMNLNEEVLLDLFKGYQQALYREGQGVYVMMQKFMTDFKVRSYLLETGTEQGDRKMANILQLIELLNDIQIKKEFSPDELINWLKKGIDGENMEGNEFEQRIERDDISVKILTIHKSKGLEYNIVIAPHLDMNTQLANQIKLEEYRDDDTGRYCFAIRGRIDEQLTSMRKRQAEQENRRLLYVAITRAKYKCILYRVKSITNSCLSGFIMDQDAIEQTDLMETGIECPDIPDNFRYQARLEAFDIEYKKANHFRLNEKNWRKMSYSGLSPDHLPTFIPAGQKSEDPYDQYIFNELPKGAHTGNLLHYVFEHIDFTEDASIWKKTVVQALKRLSARGEADEYYEKKAETMTSMLEQVLQTAIESIAPDFSLKQIPNHKKINELEFDYPVRNTLTRDFMQLSTPETPWSVKSDEELQGVMNGKIDLFFEQDGKFYILDWKSNHLGYGIEDYSREKVWQAMADNNYHLQYHIYTVAVYQFLKLRKPDFDYEKDFGGVIYLFLRGIRSAGDSGIFYHKPSVGLIESLRKTLIGS